MLLYESAKVPHGRQFPLEGEYYENILVHFGIHGTQSQTQLKINQVYSTELLKQKFETGCKIYIKDTGKT